MIHRARKILTGVTAYGLLLTVAVVAVWRLGLLDNLELWAYDRRAATCQFFTPPPTDRLVHLDVDDAALDSIGSWPWHRATLAEIVDELRLAKPKVLAWDVLFSEPQDVRRRRRSDGTDEVIDDDALFAASLKEFGRALVPMSLPILPPRPLTPVQRELRSALDADLELDVPAATAAVRARCAAMKAAPAAARDVDEQVAREFLPARREAVYDRVLAELRRDPSLTPAQLRPRLLPHTDPFITSPAVRVLQEAWDRASSELALLRFAREIPKGLPPLLSSDDALTPVPSLAKVAAGTAFFDYPKERSGTVRRVPLFMEHAGRMYPHISIALAAMMLDADINDFRFGEREVTIPRRGGPPIVLPVYTYASETLHRPVPMMFDIPWFGTDNWETMYDRVGGAHLSMNAVWDACLTRQRIRHNNTEADAALHLLYAEYDPDKGKALDAHPLPPDDPLARLEVCRGVLADLGAFIDAAQVTKRSDVKDDFEWTKTQSLAAAGRALRYLVDQNPKLATQLAAQRKNLRQRMGDRAVLVGWAATASLADLVPTSIHPKCPGVVIHGTIFSAILSGELWHRTPAWLNALVIAGMGLVATVLATRLTPARALVYSAMLGTLYVFVNGLLLFDWGNRIVSLAGPVVAVIVVWAGCTVARLLTESIERARIMRRFRSYVDPTLVNYVVAHPEQIRLEGELRELTVVFTDLEGFTKLTERLGERAVTLLNEFMGVAVPIIREHGGYVNKFLGDGIMFFFGAPEEMTDHAARAVRTVLDLCASMTRLNESLVARGYPPLALRAGISTGQMVVGDAGTLDASDYTVLGDCVNLGARLEGANKVIGSSCLCTERTVELSNGEFLVRPVGKLRVVGKQHGVMTYEPLASVARATPEQRRLVEMSTAVVEPYLAGEVNVCLEAAVRMETELRPSRFTAVYREQCQQYLQNPSENGFDHAISLTEK